jgi:hypothetical protein
MGIIRGKTMPWRLLLTALVVFSITSGTALAVWLGGWNLSGQMTATSGTQQPATSETWNVNVTDDSNTTSSFNIYNGDGPVTERFTTNMAGVNSTNPNCNFEQDKDLKFYIKINGGPYVHINETGYHEATINPGDNNISVIVEPSRYRCPLNGTYELAGEII